MRTILGDSANRKEGKGKRGKKEGGGEREGKWETESPLHSVEFVHHLFPHRVTHSSIFKFFRLLHRQKKGGGGEKEGRGKKKEEERRGGGCR